MVKLVPYTVTLLVEKEAIEIAGGGLGRATPPPPELSVGVVVDVVDVMGVAVVAAAQPKVRSVAVKVSVSKPISPK